MDIPTMLKIGGISELGPRCFLMAQAKRNPHRSMANHGCVHK
jgi:hypothetical protein